MTNTNNNLTNTIRANPRSSVVIRVNPRSSAFIRGYAYRRYAPLRNLKYIF
jgi:hypothetical protein